MCRPKQRVSTWQRFLDQLLQRTEFNVVTLDDIDVVNAQPLQALLPQENGTLSKQTADTSRPRTCLYACSHTGRAKVEVGGTVAPHFGRQDELKEAAWESEQLIACASRRTHLVARDVLERGAKNTLRSRVAIKTVPPRSGHGGRRQRRRHARRAVKKVDALPHSFVHGRHTLVLCRAADASTVPRPVPPRW